MSTKQWEEEKEMRCDRLGTAPTMQSSEDHDKVHWTRLPNRKPVKILIKGVTWSDYNSYCSLEKWT
jgi:hypothetical protein